jgi:dihydropteroate synthase
MRAREQFELQIGGRTVRLGERTLIMGVLNVTPDSFSDGGRYLAPRRAIEHGLAMARDGADWIDVGGESTRPGSNPVSLEEELHRVLAVIRALHRAMPRLPISIDTTKAEVAEEAVRAGASILNDISGLRFDPRVAQVARRHRTSLVLMHLRGRPETMQQKPFAQSIWLSMRGGLARSIRVALTAGVRRSQLIVDPGLGFGKTRRQNFEILAQLERLRSFHLPVLVGSSRKSFIQAVVAGEGLSPGANRPGRPPNALANMVMGNAAAVVAAILSGAHIVRVHDVNSIVPAVRIADAILSAQT